ncbi:MAG TPA: hypothetical protein VNI54_03905 [Thermoanaerobaculia bacterium]|nr:hypothetical protein [Thermoanaerobaculia bacterium]
MLPQLLRIILITGGIVLCTLMPFLPGRYDALAVPISMLAQLFAKVGLLLVPAGIVWMFSARAGRVVAIIACALVALVLSLGIAMESIALGVIMFAFGASLVVRLIRTQARVPLYLIAVPIAVALIQFAVADRIVESSRSRGIRNSAAIIADIERYRVANGRYPESVVSMWPDYWPGSIGIRRFEYEPNGDSYNLMFENPTVQLGLREIVMYNPKGEQRMTSHAMDVLQLTPAQLALDRQRGHNALHDARQPGWKYFWFD